MGGQSPPLEPDSGRLIYRDGATSSVSRICKALSVDSRLNLNKRSENNSESDEENNAVRKTRSSHCPAHGGSLPAIILDTLKPANQSQGGSPLSSRTVDRSTGRGVDRYQDRNADSHYKHQYSSQDSVPKPIHDTTHMHRLELGQGQEQGHGQFKVGFKTPKGYNSDDNATAGYAGERGERERERGERERKGEGGQHFLQHSDPRNLSLSVPRPEVCKH